MVWTTVWFLLVLKIPVAYLAWVIWWAVKDPPEPRPGEPARVTAPLDGPDPRRFGRRLPRPRHPAPHGSPHRRPARTRTALARASKRIRS